MASRLAHPSGIMQILTDVIAPETVFRLGRGVVVDALLGPPAAWAGACHVTINDAVLRASAEALGELHRCWSRRVPVVVELCSDVDELRAPETNMAPPYQLSPRFEFGRERLYFLARANNYDNRSG